MPVHLDTHNPGIDLTPGTTKSQIVAFLYSNSEFGYKPAEVSDELDIPRGTATTTLKRLRDQGYVAKTEDSYYHALEDREDLRRYVASLDQLDRVFSDDSPASVEGETDTSDVIDDAKIEAEVAELDGEFDE